jgi:hypothetical protein
LHKTTYTAAIKKYYRRKKGLELSCSIYGPTITRDKIAVTAWILPVRSLQIIGWLFPEVKVRLLHNKGKNKGKEKSEFYLGKQADYCRRRCDR